MSIQDFLFSPSLPNPLGAWFGEDRYHLHPLSASLPLMDVRWALTLSVSYVIMTFLLVLWMRKRQPYDLFGFRVFHNIVLVLASGYMAYGLTREALKKGYSLFCNKDLAATLEEDQPMADFLWLFYASKVYEFLDTVIMALRKKEDQITLLHVYHHASIFIVWWMNVYYFPYGDAYFAPVYNCIVHVLMYSYYLASSFQIPCPWKSYLTMFQIGQFVFFVLQGASELYIPGCFQLTELSLINFIYAFTLLALFVDFYRKSYVSRKAGASARGSKGPASASPSSSRSKKEQ
jgi:hypothetical protein